MSLTVSFEGLIATCHSLYPSGARVPTAWRRCGSVQQQYGRSAAGVQPAAGRGPQRQHRHRTGRWRQLVRLVTMATLLQVLRRLRAADTSANLRHPNTMRVGTVWHRTLCGWVLCAIPKRCRLVTVWHPDTMLVGDSVTSRHDAGGWQCDIPTRCWWVIVWHPDTMLVDDSVTSRHDAGGWQCDIPTRCWWVTVWHPDTVLVGDSVTSRHDAGGWQCDIPTRCRWVTVWHPDTMLVGDSVTSRHDAGGWQCDIPTRCRWVLRVGNMSSCDSGRHDSWMLTFFAYTVSTCMFTKGPSNLYCSSCMFTKGPRVLHCFLKSVYIFKIISMHMFTKSSRILYLHKGSQFYIVCICIVIKGPRNWRCRTLLGIYLQRAHVTKGPHILQCFSVYVHKRRTYFTVFSVYVHKRPTYFTVFLRVCSQCFSAINGSGPAYFSTPVPNKPTVSVDVKQHSTNQAGLVVRRFQETAIRRLVIPNVWALDNFDLCLNLFSFSFLYIKCGSYLLVELIYLFIRNVVCECNFAF